MYEICIVRTMQEEIGSVPAPGVDSAVSST